MDNDYTGSYAEVISVANSAPQMDGNTYCGWVESVAGRKIMLIGTLTKRTFVDAAISTTDTDSDGEPDGSDPTPSGPVAVTTSSPWLTLLHINLLVVWLARRRPLRS
tara:strand:+ start:844 stop:1164 length:321 start_codon:yes stop_codon:yes gene_type:complete